MFHPQWQKAEGDCMRQEPQHRVLTAYYAPTMTVAVWKAIFCFCFFFQPGFVAFAAFVAFVFLAP